MTVDELERFATTPLQWKLTGDNDLPYRAMVDGHELRIRVGEFPVEPMYLLYVDGKELYAIDDWPNAWKKPFPLNWCDNSGWLVDSRELPADPIEHDVETLPRFGCTNLRCGSCGALVRNVAGWMGKDTGVDPAALYELEDLATSSQLQPNRLMRLYTCRCDYHAGGNERRLDDNEGPTVAAQWMCAGHPLATLPHAFDGVTVTAENLEALVAQSVAGEVPAPDARATDRNAGAWAARMYIRLEQTKYAPRVVTAVVPYLTSPDAAIRVRALYFFSYAQSASAAMRADVLLDQHPALFVGVTDPFANSRTPKTLEHLIWRVAKQDLVRNAALCEIARRFALDPARSSDLLFIALAQHDAAWFTANAGLLAAANPERKKELRSAAAAGDLPRSVYAAIENA